MKVSKIKITTKSGKKEDRWRLSYYSALLRGNVQRRFRTEEDARAAWKEVVKRRVKGLPAPVVQANAYELADIAAALDICRLHNTRIIDAVNGFFSGKAAMTEANRKNAAIPGLDDLIASFVAEKSLAGCREATLKSYHAAIKGMARCLKVSLPSATTADIDLGMGTADISSVSKNTYLRNAQVFYGWMIKAGHRTDNPCDSARSYKVEDSDPCIYTAAQTETLMRTVARVAPQFVRVYAIALFTGIRPDGIAKLTEADLLLDENLIKVGFEQDKTGQKYYAEIPPNCMAWIKAYPDNQEMVINRYSRSKICKDAGVEHGHDIYRHTFASHHLAAHGNVEKTVQALTHRSSDMLFRHYRHAVKPDEGKAYFLISPK